MDATTILIVEDEAIVALDLKLQLQELGYEVVATVASADQAIAATARLLPQLILMDVRLQGAMDGIEAAEVIRQRHQIPVIFLTSHSDNDTVRRAAHTAPYGYLTKPYQIKELRAGIEVALTKARMERQLREADRWFVHTLQCVSDGVVVTDLQAQVRFLNPAAEQLTGWSLEDATGRPVTEVVGVLGPDSGAARSNDIAQRVADVLRDGRALPVAHARQLLPRTGAARLVDESAGPVSDTHGARLGAVLVLRDAAPRLALEAQLRASEARFRSAFDFAPLGIALVSFAGEFLQVNDAMCSLLGRSSEAIKRLNCAELTVEADRAHEAERLCQLALAEAGVVQFEKRFQRPLGGPVWTLVSASVLRDAGQPSCYLYQVHDLTVQKNAADQLAKLADERMRREASELANTAKSEFLSRVSHEMRTPLNAVMGFAQLLQLQRAAPQIDSVGRYADHIHAAGKHLLALVTDLLDLNQVGQGQLRMEVRPHALAPQVADAMALIGGQAAAHGVALDTDVNPGLVVVADAQRLRQVLINLGSNAIKYNRQGGSVRIRAAPTAAGMVQITIHDNGIGMTGQQLERLFQPFERLGAELTAVPGTGLGLVIARSLVVEMGGSLSVDSVSRVGTTVTVLLRAA